MKDKDQDGVNSNAGFIDLGDKGDQIRDGLKYGSKTPLQPVINTEPGNKLGQATQNKNSGLRVRIERALAHSPRCYTWTEVQPPSDPDDPWPCNPFSATESDGVQATAVILVPIIVEDFTQLNGNKKIHVVPDGSGGEIYYLLAYFWVDAEATWKNPATGNWDMNPSNTKGAIWGRWIHDAPTQLSVFDRGDCGSDCDIIDYDPDAIIKIVQLIE
ncbi:MAG: hypothetical protein R3C29_02850 [Dehalococcoidia bacterium]